jgi:hypothetical protein
MTTDEDGNPIFENTEDMIRWLFARVMALQGFVIATGITDVEGLLRYHIQYEAYLDQHWANKIKIQRMEDQVL